MKREAKLLLGKACDSLLLSVELFNRPHESGRVSGSLIQLDHAFEMLLKAAIVLRGGSIREKRARETIGFGACVRKGLSDGSLSFLNKNQALTLESINSQRDAAQHYLLEITENQLYLHMQSGLTLFRDLLKDIFNQDLATYMPKRVLPISITPPTDLINLFDSEIKEIKKLLQPGRRRQIEAESRIRPLAILDATIKGEKLQPSSSDLKRIGNKLNSGEDWTQVFTGVAAIDIIADGNGPTLSLRISNKEGIPIQLVPEGTANAAVVGVKRVNELDYYNLGAKKLAEKLNLTVPKTLAVINHLKIQSNADYFKEIPVDKTIHKRYSQKALEKIRKTLDEVPIEEIWTNYSKRNIKQ